MSIIIEDEMLQDLGAERAQEVAAEIEKVFHSIRIRFTEGGKLLVSQSEVDAEIVYIRISAKIKKDGACFDITRESELREVKP